MTEYLPLAKSATKFVVSQSCAFITSSIVKNNVAPTNKLQQAELVVGAYVIGALIGEKAADYAGHQFDALVETVKKFKKETNQ